MKFICTHAFALLDVCTTSNGSVSEWMENEVTDVFLVLFPWVRSFLSAWFERISF